VSEQEAKTDQPPPAQPALYRIGELAERAGVSRQVVSTYCMYGLLKESARTPGGQRLFDESAARRIRLIHDLKRRYTLREIREIFIRDRL
jgi:MerR family copper efflux transcriptional regulator